MFPSDGLCFFTIFVGESGSGKVLVKRGKYRGVYWDKKTQKWRSVFIKDRKSYRLGSYNTEREAAIAYDKFAIIHGAETNILKPLKNKDNEGNEKKGADS